MNRFPQGEQGPFRNIGEEHWKEQLEKWRKKDVYTMYGIIDLE